MPTFHEQIVKQQVDSNGNATFTILGPPIGSVDVGAFHFPIAPPSAQVAGNVGALLLPKFYGNSIVEDVTLQPNMDITISLTNGTPSAGHTCQWNAWRYKAGTQPLVIPRVLNSAVAVVAPSSSSGRTTPTTGQTAVLSSATTISGTGLNRQAITVFNPSSNGNPVYLGWSAGVTTSTGYRLDPGFGFTMTSPNQLYGIAVATTTVYWEDE